MREYKGDDLMELPDVENHKNQQNVDFYLSFEAISPDLLFIERLEIIVCQQYKECFECMFVVSHFSNLHVQHMNILHTWNAVAFHHHTIKSNFTCTINSLYIHESVNLWIYLFNYIELLSASSFSGYEPFTSKWLTLVAHVCKENMKTEKDKEHPRNVFINCERVM